MINIKKNEGLIKALKLNLFYVTLCIGLMIQFESYGKVKIAPIVTLETSPEAEDKARYFTDEPFIVRPNDSSCPCAYNPQNPRPTNDADEENFGVPLGTVVKGSIIYEFNDGMIPSNASEIRVTVHAEDPYGNDTFIKSSFKKQNLEFSTSVSDDMNTPVQFPFSFDLYSEENMGNLKTYEYRIYITLEAVVKKKGKKGGAGTTIVETVTTDMVFIPVRDKASDYDLDQPSWSPYPNPMSDLVNIQQHATIQEPYQLYNYGGMLVKEGSTVEGTINTAELGKGLYLLVIGNRRHILTKQ